MNVRRQAGYSLVELTLVVSILALMTTFASIAIGSLNDRAKLTRTSSAIVDALSGAREAALTQHDLHIIEIPVPPVGTDVVDHFKHWKCRHSDHSQCSSGPHDDPGGAWVAVPLPDGGRAEPGAGIVFPATDRSKPFHIKFIEAGVTVVNHAVQDPDVGIAICPVHRDTAGALRCSLGTSSLTVKVRPVTGLVRVVR